MSVSYLGRRRSRPVADAPALDGAELAKAWLVELVAVAPLERAARLPGPRFAEDAPRLCGALVAALASDAALHDLEPGGPLAPLAAGAGQLAAAPSPLEAVAALEALRSVTWSAVMEAADRPIPSQVADLADRLSAVIAVLTTAALDTPDPVGPTRPGDRGPLATVLREVRANDHEPGPQGVGDANGDTGPTAAWSPTAEAPAASSPIAPPEDGLAADDARDASAPFAPPHDTAADERALRGNDRGAPAAEAPPSARDALIQIEAALRDAAHAADPLADAAARLRALEEAATGDPFAAAATRLRETAPVLDQPRISRLPEVEDATEFSDARVTPWAGSIERRLARHRGDALPFAVLCLELVDADRLVASDLDRDVVEMLEQAEAAILAQLRPADALIRERPGRYWLTTPDTDQSDGRALAHRIAAAVEALPPHRGAPLHLAIGVTTCPADASDARTLENRAEEALFAARAGGVRVAGPPGA